MAVQPRSACHELGHESFFKRLYQNLERPASQRNLRYLVGTRALSSSSKCWTTTICAKDADSSSDDGGTMKRKRLH